MLKIEYIGRHVFELKINESFKKLIPPLSREEFDQLSNNCVAEGIRDKIILWNNYIIDGHNRYEIAQTYNLEFEVEQKEFESEQDVIQWMILNQFGRRNLSNYQRSVLALQLEDVFKERAKERQIRKPESVSQKSEKQNIDSYKELGKIANVSHDTIARVKKIEAVAPEEVKEKLRSGDLTINQAFQDIRKQEKKAERIELIEKQIQEIEQGLLPELKGLFDVVSVDPPWAYEEKGGFSYSQHDENGNRGGVDYPTMTVNQIKEINLPLKENSIVFLWTTHLFLKDAFEILDQWGLQYKATMVWDKEKMGMGRTIRLQCEFCLIGFKGNPYFEGSSIRDIIREPRREHSRKPDLFFSIVEKSTIGRRLEYFSREKRNNWEIYGNDTEKF